MAALHGTTLMDTPLLWGPPAQTCPRQTTFPAITLLLEIVIKCGCVINGIKRTHSLSYRSRNEFT